MREAKKKVFILSYLFIFVSHASTESIVDDDRVNWEGSKREREREFEQGEKRVVDGGMKS